MSKQIDLKVINAKDMDYQTMINEAKWLENLSVKGRSVEDIESQVKDFLNLGEGESIIAQADEKVKEYNLLKRNLINLNKLTSDLKSANTITEEEEAVLNTLESKLADKVSNIYKIDNLYVQEEGNE